MFRNTATKTLNATASKAVDAARLPRATPSKRN